MFREMRRNRQELTREETIAILERNTHGVLAASGDDGYPYAVPLSYIYADGKIYFHCALTGHKIDAIARNEKVSFCVVDQDKVVPEKYTTHFRSVIAFGRARILTDEEKRAPLEKLGRKYHPHGTSEELNAEISGGIARMHMIEITIDHMTGKQCRELIGQPV